MVSPHTFNNSRGERPYSGERRRLGSSSAAGQAHESRGMGRRESLDGSRRDPSLIALTIDDRGNIHSPLAAAHRPGTPRILGRIPPDRISPRVTPC
jgi:hypothetical protein